MDLKQARSNMIEQQIRPWGVLDQRVLSVMTEIPREQFVDTEWRNLAYSDHELPIGHGQSLFRPAVDGRLLQALQLRSSDRVLEIGTGSGYLCAALSRLSEHVHSVEIVPALAEAAAERLRRLGFDNVTLQQQDASEMHPGAEHYDAIVFGGAVPCLPEHFTSLLRTDGRLFVIIGEADKPVMEAQLLTRSDDSTLDCQSLFDTRVPLLQHFRSDLPRFVF